MKALAFRVGLFAVVAVALLVTTVVVVGGRWFAATERAVIRFETSVYGLEIGAPVVLRGVRVGQVVAIGLAPEADKRLVMPVVAEFDRATLTGVLGPDIAARQPAVAALVAEGLVARLVMQSLLTGLLYVDLDIDPAVAEHKSGLPPPTQDGLPIIPTQPTRLQTIQNQLQSLDLGQIAGDLAEIATSARQLLADPKARGVLVDAADAAQAVTALAQRLEREIGPLARSAEATLAESRRTMQPWGQAAQQLGQAAAQIGSAASQVQALAAAGTPLAAELQRAATELGRSATVLREAAAEGSALRQNTDRALQDVSRAARSLGDLGELLERHPDAILRGRGPAP